MNRSADSNPQFPDADSSARAGPPVRDGSFAGRLKALSICDVLEFLRVLNRRGVLVLRDGGREVSVQVRDGKITGVVSNHEDGNLAGFLFREGQISSEQMEAALERERNGERPVRILIETEVLTPKGLWEVLRRQSQRIIRDLFEWEKGEFQFHEARELPGVGMDLGLPILDLVGEGIRSVKTTRLFTERMPSELSVFEANSGQEVGASLPLEPHERYVLALIDGERSLGEVVRISEIGRAETLRVIFLLFSAGYLKMRAYQAPVTQARDGEIAPLIRRYNEMFSYLHRYLVKEVGPIGEAILSRYLMDQKKQQPTLLADQILGRDGTLDERLLQKCTQSLGNGGRMERLLDGLNEILYAELLAVRRTLGPQHEGRAVQGLRELGLQPVLHSEASPEEAQKD